MTEIERVARAIDAVQLWTRFNDWTRDHVRGLPIEVCRHGSEGEPEIVVIERFPEGTDRDAALYATVSLERARAAIAAMQADRPVGEDGAHGRGYRNGLMAARSVVHHSFVTNPRFDEARKEVYRLIDAMIAAPSLPADTYAAGWRDRGEALSISKLQAAHVKRQEEWCPDQKPDLSFRGNEMAGEVGEACNVIKKLERERHGWRGSRATVADLADELADVVHTAILCAITAGIDLEPSVTAKFNATSEKNGLAVMLPLARAALREDTGHG